MNIFTFIATVFCISYVHGFSASNVRMGNRPDTANLVEDALKISATFGLDSKEAAVAWDAVEEVDASDNR
jgi:CP12 domain